MTESLASFQSSLGRALRGESTCSVDSHSAGFRFTMSVRRSWCESRSTMAARSVLKLLPQGERQGLVGEYVDQGGGLAWFQSTESERFLSFLAPRLPDPSHALTICRMSQALSRARLGTASFHVTSQLARAGPVVRGAHAALVWFYAEPGAVISALEGGRIPPLGSPHCALLFAPGMRDLFRIATGEEAALWASLAIAKAPPALVANLLMEGVLAYRSE
jgi:hypothetical protein